MKIGVKVIIFAGIKVMVGINEEVKVESWLEERRM